MTANELRQKYLDFFKSKGHAIIPSASLIPDNDPTVLFTTAGMHPLVPYLMGEKHPLGKRLANSQKSIRTGDIDDVGDNRHLTFFEMLGNWSLGDYFKKEAIEWSFEFLTGKEWLGMDPQRLYVTVFMGDENCPQDQESIDVWKKCFNEVDMKAEVCPFGERISGNKDYRIFPLPAKDNWWGPAGETGPCGPCTEMFYDTEPQKGALEKTFDEEIDSFRVMEVWNDVFMEFNKNAAGQFEKLPAQNVDTGMGLERTVSVLAGKKNAFDNELFSPLFVKIGELSGKKYGDSEEIDKNMRIVADHIKAATFILGDEKAITPSNVGQGYVLRRLIRRAVRYGKQLGINKIFTFLVAEEVVKIYADIYPELKKNKEFITSQLIKEEEKFSETLERGLKLIDKLIKNINVDEPEAGWRQELEDEGFYGIDSSEIKGKWFFNFYQTYGFPFEMLVEELNNRGISFDAKQIETIKKDFQEEQEKHQELSRTASAGMFKGGLADASEETIKYHTAAHLMLAALRQVFGEHVAQKGSNITPERLRFDFSHSEKMTPEQVKRVEDIVNEQIQKDLPVVCEEMGLDEAKAAGAMGVFESKYGEKVKVYSIGGDPSTSSGPPFSREICGGPHAERTGVLGKFKIQKEESSSSGIRRIKAILE